MEISRKVPPLYLPDMSRLASRPLSSDATDSQAQPVARRARLSPEALAAGVLTVAYACLFGYLSLQRYWAFQMHALDMGNMGQAAWNTLHGHPFFFTNMRLPYWIEAWNTTTRLSFHVEALFPVISLVYLVYPHPESLLILQTLALASGAIPVFLLARDVVENRRLALIFTVVYLLFPSVEAMNLYEFHPVALATPLLLFAFLFAFRRQYLPFVLCCLAAMGTKEQIGLVVAMFGFYVAVVQRNWRVGLATAAAGIAWSLFAVVIIEHHFRLPGTRTYLRTRYGYLGHGVGGAIHTVLRDPGVFLRVLFVWPKLGYLERLLAPAGYLSLLAPTALLLGAPSFALNLLSQDPHMYSGLGDNSAELISVVMIAAILGSRTLLGLLGPRFGRSRSIVILAVYLLAVAIWCQIQNGYTPAGAMYQVASIGTHQRIQNRFVSMIPPSAPISTQDELDPHLSSRQYLYLFEDTGRIPPLVPANLVLLDVSGPTYPLPSYQLHDRAMSLLHQGWGVKAAHDGLILLQWGLSRKTIPAAFYSYMDAGNRTGSHRLARRAAGLTLLGYEVERTDLPNHYVPNLAYTFYLRASGPTARPMQPVVLETMGGKLISCANDPLGLSWLPTTRWKPGRTYVVRMSPIETTWQTPGTASLSVQLLPSWQAQSPCSSIWRKHASLWPLGTLRISF